MINFQTTPQVNKKFFTLRKGDVIETTLGIYAFDRIPKGGQNWYGKSMKDGKSYRIRIKGFDQELKVIGHYNFVDVTKLIKPSSNDVNTLIKDDLFVIKHGRGENAELFRFVRATDKKVIAVNPITNKIFNIDKSFTFTKITNLPY